MRCVSWKGVVLLSALQDGTPTSRTFEHVGSEVGAEEAEEVGVEHLLRWEGQAALPCVCTLSAAYNMHVCMYVCVHVYSGTSLQRAPLGPAVFPYREVSLIQR